MLKSVGASLIRGMKCHHSLRASEFINYQSKTSSSINLSIILSIPSSFRRYSILREDNSSTTQSTNSSTPPQQQPIEEESQQPTTPSHKKYFITTAPSEHESTRKQEKVKKHQSQKFMHYSNKSFLEIIQDVLRRSVRFFAHNYYLVFAFLLLVALMYALDVFNLRTEKILSERAKLEELEWRTTSSSSSR
ncbi:hypothetical protein C9374_012689 [Naegleria lovaniensis]|uniref:Uncharacterized protein n=1 Tax=Naegleria lovaniensis TaxID=51637 RepID=A0AA88KQK6_NAELO|nr:uncharacterized protein C9374_012689 [Naegleria lovaniensis]KAG2392437.1 hypothetical protein C9374_012689 [Naegleria lovaniensis]